MASKPLVSVLIPTYNHGPMLREAIESVLAQTFTDFELVVVDNCSTDNTHAIVQQFIAEPRLRYYRNKATISMWENWNEALCFARGTYIKYLCSDDRLEPQTIERMVAAFKANPDAAVVSCGRRYFGEKHRVFELPYSGRYDGKQTILNTLRTYNWLASPSTVMLRHENFEVGGFRPYRWITDWEMWVRHLTMGAYVAIPEVLVWERVHNGSVTRTHNTNQNKLTEEYKLYRNIYDGYYGKLFPGQEAELAQLVKRKALHCSRFMFSRLRRLHQKKARDAFHSMLRIVAKEGMLWPSLLTYVKRMLGRPRHTMHMAK